MMQWQHTAEEFHRMHANLPVEDGSQLRHDGLAPVRDGRNLIIADMIRDYHDYHTGLLRVMQRLCWARLLQRNANFVPLSLGAQSPAFCISCPPPPFSSDDGLAVYDPLVLRIIQGMLPQPSHKALSRHLRGLRHQTYRDTLPSFQTFT